MIEDGHGNERGFCSGSSQRTGVVDHQNLNLLQSSQRSGGVEKSLMETEGRSFSDFYRNSSEEIFLNTLMESSIGIPAPTMETLGFKNLSQPFRADSEELFNSWLMNGEANGSITHRRQASRRISTELAALSHHNNGGTFQNRHGNSNLMQQNVGAPDDSTDSQHLLRSVVEKGVEASNLYLAKAWFQSSQPMTRSRSSELRKRYAAMQNFQMPTGMNLAHNTSTRDTISTKQEFTTTSGFSNFSMGEMPNQLGSFMSPSNSSSSPFDAPPMAPVDAVSSVVSMLKGTLERKKLSNHTDKEISNGSSFAFYGRQDIMAGNQGGVSQMPELLGAFQGLTPGQMKASRNLQTVDESVEIDIEDFIAPSNPIQMTTVSQEPSQSESSAAAPVLSTGFDACDGPASSAPALSICESSRNHISNGSSEHDAKAKEIRERMFENNIKNDRKKGSLVRMGSITSGGSVDKADPTKKRRVERSRKMAEAKERNMTPVIPSDLQAILKRCENLEKEVRSLKLNLSFMNRKDSEQTKQIEELQKQNEELADEKERLLEEIERILSESGKM